MIRAYRNYRRCQSLPTQIADPERERTFADALKYHLGACELAEIVGDGARARHHQEAFLKVWEAWFHELTHGGAPPRGEKNLAVLVARLLARASAGYRPAER